MANLSNINNKFLVTTGGDVGIGVTSPGEKLDVDGNIRVRGISATKQGVIHNSGAYFSLVSTGDTSDTTGARIWLGNNSSANAYYQNASSHYFRDLSSSIKMTLDSSGNIGIGTVSPGTLHGVTYGTTRLHVDGGTDRGQMIIEGDSFAGIVLSDNGTTANERVFSTSVDDGKYTIKPLNDNGTSTAGGVAVTVLHGGEVGIGTTSPIGKTDIFVGASGYTNNVTTLPVGTWSFSNGSGSNSYPSLVSKSNATGTGMTLLAATDDGAPNGMDFNIRKGDNTDFSTLTTSGFTFSRFGTVLTTILRNGNVGIGQTGPGQKLVIGNYDSVANGTMRITALGGQGVGTIRNSLEFSLSSEFSVNSSDAYKFSVGLNSAVGNSGNYNSDFVIRRTTRLGVTDNVDFMIDGTSGNIGIGVTNPQMGLHVADTKGALFGPSGSGTASAYFSPSDENTLNGSYGIDTDVGDLWLNYRGYQDGFTRFRDTRIGNGKGGVVALFDGSTGNVGIGTTSETVKLDVNGGARFNTSTGADPVYITRSGSNDQALKIYVDDAAAIFESIQDESADNYGAFQFVMDAGVTEPYFDVRKGAALANTLFRVDGNGNVGIGTTGPDSKIQVEARNASNVIYGGFRVGYNATSNNYYDADTHHFRLGTGSSAGGNLYVGGGVYLGGTAAANKLDDYEEGTWTPGVRGSSTAGTVTYGARGGSYTKIGNTVTCWFSILNFSQSGAAGNFEITGLPFTCVTTNSVRGCFSSNVRFYRMPFAGDVPVISLSNNNTFFAILWSRNNTTWLAQSVSNTGNQYIEGYVTYTTT